MQGGSLSLVQSMAVEMLYLVDRRKADVDKADHLRMLVAGNHPERIKTIFPEWFPKEPEVAPAFQEAVRPDGTVDPDKVDESQIEWSVPDSEEERLRLEQWIAEHSHGQINAAELERRRRT